MSADTIFVTGATGFLGTALVGVLLAQGRDVIASGRRTDRLVILEQIGARTLQFDLGREDLVIDELPIAHCRQMVHCAALSSPWGRRAEFVKANIAGTRTAIALAHRLNVQRFVHISTPSVYFQFRDQEGVKEETSLPRPVNAYAETKADAEKLVLAAHDLDSIILRPRGLYGVGDEALLPRLLATARQRALPMMRDGAAAIDLTHVGDVVSAIVAALDIQSFGAARVFNVSGGKMLPIVDVVEAACARAGIDVRWRDVPVSVVMAYARSLELICGCLPHYPEPQLTAYGAGLFAYRQSLDLSRAKAHLNWSPQISFEEGLERTFSAGEMGALG